MKKVVNVETHVCDACGKQQGYIDHCLHCGVEHCYECKPTHGIDYKHGVYFSGSGDGYYCTPCDRKLTTHGGDKRHTAYRTILALRNEVMGWNEDFKRRMDAAEAVMKKLTP